MNNVKIYMLFIAALACSAQTAYARRGDILHYDGVVEKGQVLEKDLVTDKSLTVNGVLDGDAVSVGGAPVTVNGEITGNLVSIGGRVEVTGRVRGDVAGIGGPVAISGKVGGNVTSVGDGVELSGAGEVDGDISAVGGAVVKGEKTVHRGEVISLDTRMIRTVLPRILKTVRYAGEHRRCVEPWLAGGLMGLGVIVFFSMLAAGALLLVLTAVFFPKNVENAAAALYGNLWRACWIGALLIVCFLPGLFIMVVSILGIPLVPFALMLYAAAGVLGLSAFSVLLQRRFFEGIGKGGPSGLPGKVAAGYAIMAALLILGKLVPFIGGVLSLIGCVLLTFGAMLGLGAVWLTRMGGRAYSSAAPSPAPQPPAEPQAQ